VFQGGRAESVNFINDEQVDVARLRADHPLVRSDVLIDADVYAREQLVRQLPGDGVARHALAAATAAPLVGRSDSAGEHRAVGLEQLADDLQAEVVQAGERGQVRARKGSVEHVEVFRVAGVGTSIIGRPRPLPSGRRAHYLYTLICDEPS